MEGDRRKLSLIILGPYCWQGLIQGNRSQGVTGPCMCSGSLHGEREQVIITCIIIGHRGLWIGESLAWRVSCITFDI